MDEERAIPQNITLYPDDRKVVEGVMERYSIRNFSAAVQFIIQDWKKLTAAVKREAKKDRV